MIPLIGPIIAGITGIGKEWLQGRREIKKAKIGATVARFEAQAEREKHKVDRREDYDLQALKQMQYSWKDEWFVFVFTLPVIGAFIPGIQDHVLIGFEYLEKTPEWYRWIIIGMVAATFGLRWLFGGKIEKMFKTAKTKKEE